MDIQAEKIELVKIILEIDNPDFLSYLKRMLKTVPKKDFWDTLPQFQKDEILKGIEEVENGEIVDYEDFMIKHR
jgi:hypothetical protein